MSEWSNPGSDYRSKVFWAWNGKLETDRLCRQIGNMAQMGLGGFFIHARTGLSTKYLSDEWFECVSASVEKARELHLEAWLYDEDRWPSGAAGGLVTGNSEFRASCLKASIVDTPATDAIASFPAETGYYQFRVEAAQPSNWYNNQTYLDVFNPDAVKCFIQTTHEAYRKRCQDDFGGVIPGIFTDEPYYGWSCLDEYQRCLPWTKRMPELFKARYGYDLLPELHLLFYDDKTGRHCRVRYHFHALLTELFMENFMRQIYEWCDLHKLKFTGHMNGEDQLWTQAGMHGSSMRSYAYQHIPGIDHLTEYRGLYATIKQASSAARQLGRRWRLSETYGCTGWDFPLAGHKAVGDIQFALGINQHCLHLYWYDMGGEGKRDFPASIGHQSSWWTEYRSVEDYFARLHAVTSEGGEVRDILVINPVESMWLLIESGWTCSAEKNFLDDDRRELQNRLLNAHLDFDYGDEGLMALMSSVLVSESGACLTVGKATYRAVIVPSCLTVRRSTLALLLEFQKAGGRVIFAGTPPRMLEGEKAEALTEFIAKCVSCRIDAVVQYVEFCRRVSVADAAGSELPGVLHLLRHHDDGYYLFVCNTGYSLEQQADVSPVIGPLLEERRTACPEVLIRLQAGTATPEEWDAMTGKRFRPELIDGGIIRTSLPPRSSRLYFFPFIAGVELPQHENQVTVKTEPLTGDWQIGLNEPNVVVLDSPEYMIGGDAWHSGMDVRQVDQLARERGGLPRRHSLSAQPWSLPENPIRQHVGMAYRTNFEHVPERGIILGGEYHGGVIKANGHELKTTEFQWVDESLTFFAIPPEYLKTGVNEIEISAFVSETVSLEIWYLLGDFGVRLNGKEIIVTAPIRSLAVGNWVPQGLPFYSGAVEYRRQLNVGAGSFLQIPGFRGTLAQVLADGRVLGTLLQEPYEVALPEGLREIIIRIFGSRHNSHGPLHSKSATPYVGPSSFGPERSNYLGYWQLKSYGLSDNPCVLVKKNK
ncbi:MAG: glycosyl hydrolase [Victivallales bacterium]